MASEFPDPIVIGPLKMTLVALAINVSDLKLAPDGQFTKRLVAALGTGEPVVGGVATVRLLQLAGVQTVYPFEVAVAVVHAVAALALVSAVRTPVRYRVSIGLRPSTPRPTA